ncbi:hypothetical protein K458DRAFT_326153, partial [Lentithecium fluviatile CBS 122367]
MVTMADSYYGNTSPARSIRTPRRTSTQKDLKRVEEQDVVQGGVFWLPPREELPSRAVRRAHGKGAIEEGIYNHPVLVISRPAEESQVIHFHIITSFQGKRLHEIYSKSNEFHTSRRSWYLPISPSPDHPDANSKKTRKRFPTLDLAHGATLRWDSYVNLRHVYKIEWSYLKAYSNPDTPERTVFRFDRESMIRLLAKTKTLTNYEPGPQYQYRRPILQIPSQGIRGQPVDHETGERERDRELEGQSPKSISDASSIISSEYSGLSPILQSDFGSAGRTAERSTPRPPKAPPDKRGRWRMLWRLLQCLLAWPLVWVAWIRDRVQRGGAQRTGGS